MTVESVNSLRRNIKILKTAIKILKPKIAIAEIIRVVAYKKNNMFVMY